MNELFPITPQVGLSTPVFLGLSLLLGIAFGFFLERAGFGTAKNLTSIFILRDFRVFRVMFSAVLTAMLGSLILSQLGLLNLGLVSVDPTFFWSMLVGGLVFGVGFYVGGFCPGTAVVAFMRGRWDALAFLLGIPAGIFGFALLFDGVGEEAWFRDFYAPADATRQTLYGDGAAWPWALGITLVALIGFALAPRIEKRFRLKTVDELEGRDPPKPEPEFQRRPNSWVWTRVAPVVALGAVAVLAVLETTGPVRPIIGIAQASAKADLDQDHDLKIDTWTLAGWVIADAHKRAADEPITAMVLNLRPVGASPKIPGAKRFCDLANYHGDEQVAVAANFLSGALPLGSSNTRVVLLGRNEHEDVELQHGLRHLGWQVYRIDGGVAAWQRDLLDPGTEWPLPPMAPDTASEMRSEITAWFKGERSELPPRVVFAGAIPPPLKVATVKAQNTGGGGCN